MIHDIFPHQFDNHYQIDKEVFNEDYVLHFKDNCLLMKVEGDEIRLPKRQDLERFVPVSNTTFLFTLDNVSCFIMWNEIETVSEKFEYKDISFFRTIADKEIGWASIVAFHLRNWYQEHRYCGKCGTRTEHKHEERALVCPNCKTHFFPKISPAIIVAIISNDKILLAHNTTFKGDMYSLVAGYVDVGETLEQTVAREVKEEVGIDIKNIRYYKSQPWPVSGSLMIAYIAEANADQTVVVDNLEIEKAAWFTRDNLPNYPSNASVAGELIQMFEKGEIQFAKP